jgi:Flp pilus assembly pilin Flp
MKRVIKTSNHEHGAAFLEYVLIASLIGITAIVAVQLLGGSVANSLSDSASAFAQGETVDELKIDASKTAAYKDEFEATFEVTDLKLSLGNVKSDGWTYKITKSTDRKITMKFSSEDSDDVVTVKAWLNKNDKLKTTVKEKKKKKKTKGD